VGARLFNPALPIATLPQDNMQVFSSSDDDVEDVPTSFDMTNAAVEFFGDEDTATGYDVEKLSVGFPTPNLVVALDVGYACTPDDGPLDGIAPSSSLDLVDAVDVSYASSFTSASFASDDVIFLDGGAAVTVTDTSPPLDNDDGSLYGIAPSSSLDLVDAVDMGYAPPP
jgi:hypothetical protein